jgi:septal ring factor EnvC (AmiA/AmiB activator)
MGQGAMSDTSAIDAASRRLALAMDALEAAIERRHEVDRGQTDLSEQLHALGSDRSRLASDLDTAAARVRALETTNREIARRLDVAIESVRGVLEANDR